jgi:hypothetical protein
MTEYRFDQLYTQINRTNNIDKGLQGASRATAHYRFRRCEKLIRCSGGDFAGRLVPCLLAVPCRTDPQLIFLLRRNLWDGQFFRVASSRYIKLRSRSLHTSNFVQNTKWGAIPFPALQFRNREFCRRG